MALLRAREAVMSHFRPMLREHDLTEQQWRVLRALDATPTPLRLSEIGDHTFLSLPSLSRVSKALEARGLIRRTVDADDFRAAQVRLSAQGRRLIARIAPASEGHYEAIADAIGPDDLEALYALLDRVRERLSGPAPDDDET